MAEINIVVSAPEIAAAIVQLADAIKSLGTPEIAEVISRDAEKPQLVDFPEDPPSPHDVQDVRQAPAPEKKKEAPEKQYTLDEIGVAGAALVDAGKTEALREMLRTDFGVQAITQIPPERYGDLAAALRGLGAKI